MTEILVASAIVTTAALAVGVIIQQGAKQKAISEKKGATISLASSIMEHLRFVESCDRALGASSGIVQEVDELNLIDSGSSGPGWPIVVKLPQIHSGTDMSGTSISATAPSNVIPEKRLQIDSLRLADGERLRDVAGNHRYRATIYLKTSEIGGFRFQEQPIGSTTITVDTVSHQISSCGVSRAAAFSTACADMGCTYDAGHNPPCLCKRSQVVCAAPGSVPVAITAEGYPTCMQAGGEGACAVGEYLVGFGIGYKECAPLPIGTPGPTPTATSSPTPAALYTCISSIQPPGSPGAPCGWNIACKNNSTGAITDDGLLTMSSDGPACTGAAYPGDPSSDLFLSPKPTTCASGTMIASCPPWAIACNNAGFGMIIQQYCN